MIGYPLDSHVTYGSDGTPSYDRAVNSRALRTLYKSMFSDGIRVDHEDDLKVTTNGDMTVNVAAGFAMVNGCMKYQDTNATMTISASSASFDRYDLIVMRLNANDDVRTCDLLVLEGVAAAAPAAPAITRTDAIYDIALAKIKVPANSTAIVAGNITDLRGDEDYCGTINVFGADMYAALAAVVTKVQEHTSMIAALETGRGNQLTYNNGILSLIALADDGTSTTLASVNISKAGAYYLDAPKAVTIDNKIGKVSLYWSDPDDVTIEGKAYAVWNGTKVVRKANTPPINETDGDVIYTETTRNAHKTVAFEDTTGTPGVTYYYGIFPYTKDGVYTTSVKLAGRSIAVNTFASSSWNDIKIVLDAYYNGEIELSAIGWNIGDSKVVDVAQITSNTMTGYTFAAKEITVTIVDINRETLAAARGGRTKAAYVLMAMDTTSHYNLPATTDVTALFGSVYHYINMIPKWLNNDFYNALPSGLKQIMQSVSIPYAANNNVTSGNAKVFIPQAYNLYDTPTWDSDITSHYVGSTDNKYQYLGTKKLASGCWVRDCGRTNNYASGGGYCGIVTGTSSEFDVASSNSIERVVPTFCI